ncbi:collagenase [Bacillus salitolerans]|uniref:Collagenase n=1 Tax=Bacillus salitolerans TaxID=1437434 RepID=A0ABW4LTK8_9BACI
MRKPLKILSIIFLIVFVILLSLAFVVGVFINKTLEKETNEDLPFFQSIKMALTLNFEGENERQLKENRLKEQHHHISIYYPDDFSELIPVTKETLDWAINKNEEIFGTVKVKAVDLIVFKDKDELNELSELIDISGFYSDFDKLLSIRYNYKEMILEKKETPLYFFQKSILHEYTHYTFNRMVEGSEFGTSVYPIWFQEGISEYIGNDKAIVEYSDFKLVPFSQLVNGEQWQTARFQEGANVYRQSYFAIKYLIDIYGEEVLGKIIKESNSTGDFEGSFIQTTGISIQDLENVFLNSYK